MSEENETERRSRWQACYTENADEPAQACAVLQHHAHLLPAHGTALDLACGRGGNALFLARRGLRAHAWDYADSALAALARAAQAEGLAIATACRDVTRDPPAPGSFDAIVVSNFLHRPLFPALTAALRPGGLLFYETWLGPRRERGPSSETFRLRAGELVALCEGLELLHCGEEGDRAWVVARAPSSC